ncbi:S24/S26 family peptidase [Vibrio harveyi]
MAIAQLANEDILWLLTGQNYTDNHWLQSNQCVELCLDDAMSPTLSINTPVVLEKLTPDSHLPDGIYCLESSQGRIFRRLQWDEEKQGFWLLCDNERYKPQLYQSPQVVGKAISALSPIT